MNFEFSEDLSLTREQARRFLREQCPTKVVRSVLEGREDYARELWKSISELGWTGAAIPEEYGGIGLGHEGLCLLAEELGRALAPVPFASSVYLATEAVLLHGSTSQKSDLLPRLSAGELIGTFALAEGLGNPRSQDIALTFSAGRLSGTKWPVADGCTADFAIVAAKDADGALVLCHVDLTVTGVNRQTLESFDPSRQLARIDFEEAPATLLGAGTIKWSDVEHLLDRAAVLLAFEQIGGADACLQMATEYAKERTAFGRPIGSFQAIKHKLANVYVANQLARSNAYFGAWALSTGVDELPGAASAARVSASQAFYLASKENIQTHGGMGFTWEMDCHLYFRRAKLLSASIGSAEYWKERLVAHWEEK